MTDARHERWQESLAILPGATALEQRGDASWMIAPDLDVCAMATTMARLGFRLSAMTGLALAEGETAILYHYCQGGVAINIRAETTGRTIASIAAISRVADWAEREIADLYDVQFIGHPNPTRLIRPPALVAGFFRDSVSQEKA